MHKELRFSQEIVFMLAASLKSLPFIILVAFALVVGFSSCTEKSRNTSTLLKNLDIAITESSATIQKSNDVIYESIKIKTADPAISERAIMSLSKADSLREKTERLKNILSKYSKKIIANKIEMGNADFRKLFDEIKKYNEEVANVDSQFRITATRKQLKLGAIEATGLSLFEENLLKVGAPSQSVFINKLIADIVIDENTLLNQLHNELWTQGKCIYISPIVGVNSTVISMNDSVEILAGIGYFEAPKYSKMIVEGVTIYPEPNGLFLYKYKPAGKKGRKIIPVQVYYTDVDGNATVTETKVAITVK